MQLPKFPKFLLHLAVLATLAGCKKEYDTPVEHILPTGNVVTIAQLKAMFTNAPVHFTSDMSVYGTIIADENDGNFYKNVYMQDSTGGICLRLLTSGGLYIGDKIRVYLPGTVLSPYSNLMQLDSVNVDNNVVKQSTQNHITPKHLSIAQLNTILSAGNVHDTLQSTLVQLDSVEFISTEAINGLWSDPISQTTVNHTLADCGGEQIIVRTSGYANYASVHLPTGRGSIVCVASLFGTTPQLYVRSLPEVHLTGARCANDPLPLLSKNFEDGSVTSGGWTQWSDTTVFWTTNTVGAQFGNTYGQIKNYANFVNTPCETWLISPALDLSGTVAPKLIFQSGCNYTGAPLTVLASTDYVSGDPNAATWTTLPATFSPGTWTWTPSGLLDLLPFHTSNMHFAFRYTGTNTDGKTWEVDEIKVYEP